MNDFLSSWSPRMLSILRIVAGFLLVWHGSQKLFGFPLPLPPGGEGALIVTAGVIEFFGGVMIIVGLFTRPAAFVISGMLAVAYFMVHAPAGFFPLVNKGELAAIYSFLYLYFTFAGGGEWSVDRLIERSRDGHGPTE